MLIKHLLTCLLLTLALFFKIDSHAQSVAEVTWTISPPNSPEGYANGETINICVTANNIYYADGSWAHGFQWDFPEGLDPNTLNISQQPNGCTDGTWNWYGAVTSGGSGITYGPGFFYDGEGPQDLNPGNNDGEMCISNTYTMCMDVSVLEDCFPNIMTDLTPTLTIYGGGTTGAWVSDNPAPFISQPTSDMTLVCCDAYPGESQGFVPICENGTICLFDLITGDTEPDANGFWAGPNGWSSSDDCGTFDPTIGSPGTYTYVVIGTGGCMLSASIEMGYNTLELGNSANCQNTPFDLNDYLITPDMPLTGDWYYPDTNGQLLIIVPNGIIDPSIDPDGTYRYAFYDANSCYTIGTFELLYGENINPGLETTVELCNNQEIICPFNLLEGDPTPFGQWVLYNESGVFQAYFDTYNPCVEAYIFNFQPLQFTYVIGVAPCPPLFTELYVSFSDSTIQQADISASLCVSSPPVLLETLLDVQPMLTGVVWTDLTNPPTGIPLTNPIDPGFYPLNTTLTLAYTGNNGQCDISGTLTLTILQDDAYAGEDATAEICENAPPIDMFDYLGFGPGGGAQSGGNWTGPPPFAGGNFYVPAIHPFGVYTYTVTSNCGSDSATLTILQGDATCTECEDFDTFSPGDITICQSVCLFDLLLGTPPTSGIWTGPSGWTNNSDCGTFDITTDPYGEYAYTIINPDGSFCTAIINILPSDLGEIAQMTFCNVDTFNLFTEIIIPQNIPTSGIWTNDGGDTIPQGLIVNPSLGNNTFHYSWQNGGSCTTNAYATITFGSYTVIPDTYAQICSNENTICLFDLLEGNPSPDGHWVRYSAAGVFQSYYNYFDLCFSIESFPEGNYFTYITGGPPCGPQFVDLFIEIIEGDSPQSPSNNYAAICQDTGTVNLDTLLYDTDYTGWQWYNDQGNPIENPIEVSEFSPTANIQLTYTGGTGSCQTTGALTLYFTSPFDTTQTYIDVCTGQATICLFDYVEGNPPTGGTWAEVNENGVYINFYPEYDVCLDITQMTASTSYKYIMGIPPCYPQWPLINIDFFTTPGPGTNASLTLCSSQGDIILNSLINGNVPADGQWTDPAGNEIDNTINTETALSGTYTYTLIDGPCAGTTFLTLNFETPPNAGPDLVLNFCGDGSIINLGDYIEPPIGFTGVFSPSQFITLIPANAGVYTYAVAGTNCPSDFANYTINIDEELSISNLTVACNPTGTEYTVSFSINGYGPFSVFGINGGTTIGNNFISNNIPTGIPYNFEVSSIGLCPSLSVTGDPDCQCESAYSTLTASNDTICMFYCTDITLQLEGEGPFTAVYSDGVTEYTLIGIQNGYVVSVCPVENTTYTLLSVGGANCPPTSPINEQSITIDVIVQPSAGPDVSLDFCPDNALINLYDYLHPDASSLGYFPTLYDTIVAVVSNSGDYIYYTNNDICQSDSAIYSINIFDPGNCTFEVGGGGQGISLNPGADEDGGRPAGNNPFEIENQSIKPQWDFTLFPNPLNSGHPLQIAFQSLPTTTEESNSPLTINNSPLTIKTILKVHDLTGRLIWTETLDTSENQLVRALQSTPTIDSGTYLITIISSTGEHKTKTLQITH